MKEHDARKLSSEAQEAIRLRVARFLQEGKGTQQQAADIFLISLRAVQQIWKRFKQGGINALQRKKRGPRSKRSLLTKTKVKEVTRSIKKGTPEDYGIPYTLWTANAVRLLIKKKRK